MSTVLSLLPALLLGPRAHATTCTTYVEGGMELLAECTSEDLDESSGIAWSRTREGLWYSHNDAGGLPELQVFDLEGNHVDSHIVSGAGFRDWEDLSAGPCPSGTGFEHCLYIADVGDNGQTRDSVEVYAIAEPEEGAIAPVLAVWSLTWPGGEPRDCEAVAVHPCTGRIYLFSKERDADEQPMVARAPADPTDGEVVELEEIARLDVQSLDAEGVMTGADWAPRGDRLIVRNYHIGLEWVTDPEDPDAHWAETPEVVLVGSEGQGEAIAYHPDGGLICTTERVPMSITRLACETSEEAEACPEQPGDEGGGESGGDDDTGGTGGGPDDTGGETGGEVGDGDEGGGDSGAGSGESAVSGDPEGCGCGSSGTATLALICLWPVSRRRRGRPAPQP